MLFLLIALLLLSVIQSDANMIQARDLDEVQWFYNDLDGWGWIVSSLYSDANMIRNKELDEQQWFAKQSLMNVHQWLFLTYLLDVIHSDANMIHKRDHDGLQRFGESFNGLANR